MLNFELGDEENITSTMDLREYLSATPSTSSTATIVTIITSRNAKHCGASLSDERLTI